MWHELPPQYYNSKEHPRPRFSYGIEVSFEEVEKFALELLPQLESYFDEAPDAACNAICIHFNDVCGKTRSMGFTFEGVYSKKAEFMFALANTHEKRIDERRVHEVGKKLLERLGKIGWGHKTLKWYISNDYEGMEREDWSDSTVIVEQ